MNFFLGVILCFVFLQTVQTFLHSVQNDTCSWKFLQHHPRRIEKCKTRPTIVEILSLFPTYQNAMPNHVLLDQCGGGICFGQMSCVPVKNRTIEKKVLLFDYFGKQTCHTVKLYEHESCECKCTIMEHHCNSRQKYNPQACGCVCKNEYQKRECTNAMEWDSKKCKCICRTEEECSTGSVWIPAFCRCLPFEL